MKTILAAIVLSICVSHIYGQENTTLNFSRPSKTTESASTITVSFEEQVINLKSGANLAVMLPLTYSKAINIQCNSGEGKAQFVLRAIPGENYFFEVGFDQNRIYINLISGNVDLSIPLTQAENIKDPKEDWQTSISTKDKSIGLKAEKTHSSEAIRQEWLKKGGKVSYLSLGLVGTYYRMDVENFGPISGFGFGQNYHYNRFNLKIPEFNPGITKWNSFNWGIGFDAIGFGTKMSFSEELFDMNIETGNMSIMLSASFGWTLGIGKFRSEDQWVGVALTFKYRPSFSILLPISTRTEIISKSPFIESSTSTSSGDPISDYNLGAIGFDLEFSNYYATMKKIAPKPRLKLSAFVIPPVGDLPLFVSVGLGISFYRKK